MEEIIEKLNRQLNMEFYSGYFYLHIANYYVEEKLDGFANWFAVQEQEERDHAFIILHYLQDNDWEVRFDNIASAQKSFKNQEEPLLDALEHEKAVTKSIHMLYECALLNKDYRSMQLLDWFVKEQMEEEKNIRDLQDKYRLFVQDQKSLYLLDSELKTRVHTPVSQVMAP